MALRAQNPRTERQGGVGAASEDGLGGGGRGAAPLTSPSEGQESRRRPPSGPLRPRPSQAPPGLPQMTRKRRRGTTRAGRPSRARAASNGAPITRCDLRPALRSEAQPLQPSAFLLASHRRQSQRLASRFFSPSSWPLSSDRSPGSSSQTQVACMSDQQNAVKILLELVLQ